MNKIDQNSQDTATDVHVLFMSVIALLFISLEGTVSRDFLLLVFFMNKFPPSPRVSHWDRFEFFRKFAEIFASQGAPPVANCRRYQ